MAIKTIKVCTECENECKQEIDQAIAEKAEKEKRNILVSCPKGSKFKKVKADAKKEDVEDIEKVDKSTTNKKVKNQKAKKVNC